MEIEVPSPVRGGIEKVYYKINNLQTIKILKNYGFS
jgi:hypothetical protein